MPAPIPDDRKAEQFGRHLAPPEIGVGISKNQRGRHAGGQSHRMRGLVTYGVKLAIAEQRKQNLSDGLQDLNTPTEFSSRKLSALITALIAARLRQARLHTGLRAS